MRNEKKVIGNHTTITTVCEICGDEFQTEWDGKSAPPLLCSSCRKELEDRLGSQDEEK